MSTLTAQAIKKFMPPDYLPESDGEPMAETDVHRKQLIGLLAQASAARVGRRNIRVMFAPPWIGLTGSQLANTGP